MGQKTVLVIFPSVFSLNKLEILEDDIVRILKIKDQSIARIRRNESLIVVETSDPVLVSSTVGSLFGIERLAIAREVESGFDKVLETITSTSMNLLLRGERFHVKVEGRSPDYLAKDLEVAATAALTEKLVGLEARPGSEANHDKMLYTYITKSHAYVSIFVDWGLGGVPYGSQSAPVLCCLYDELSAISCLQCVKMGFEVRMVICYEDDPHLLSMAKMVNRMLPSIVEEKITLQFCKTRKSRDPALRVLVAAGLLAAIARSKKIGRIALPVLPYATPASFLEELAASSFKKGLAPWVPLAGMDSSIIENSKQLGLEKFLANLEHACRQKFPKGKVAGTKVQKSVDAALKTLKQISISVGPKNVYDMIDSLRTNH